MHRISSNRRPDPEPEAFIFSAANQSTDPPFQLNGAIETKSKIFDVVMSSAQEAKPVAGFYNAKEIFPLRQALIDLGHPQGPTQLQFDN